jgi:hypothetical protein
MRHLHPVDPKCSQALTGRHAKFNLISTLSEFYDRLCTLPGGSESVDAAPGALYKDADGGGRNPAAAVL